MVVDKGRHGADLDGVGVVGRVLEQAVVGVKELTRHQEKELSRRATVVQPVNTTTNLAHFTWPPSNNVHASPVTGWYR